MQGRWSKDDIILAMWEWNERHGQQPRWNDWLRASDDYPTSVTVRKAFGSWNVAIVEAGFTPYESPRVDIDESLAKKMRRDGATDREIARTLGVTTDVIVHRIGRRPRPVPVGKKRTREQRIADLKEALSKGGE